MTYDIQDTLINWFAENRRDLPWRHDPTPYEVWLSEVILQQTRVNQGMDYYLRFIKKWPSVTSLAQATEEEVLKMWQGLGYYSRARNLHHCAQQVMEQHGGQFPADYEQLKKLQGIGEYTAAAIASIAFDLPHAVVDGNVYRVLARLFDIDIPINNKEGQKQFAQLADELLNRKQPGLHNQAMMEFGALQCTPKNPNCLHCPLQAQCLAFAHQTVLQRPVKLQTKKTLHAISITWLSELMKTSISINEAATTSGKTFTISLVLKARKAWLLKKSLPPMNSYNSLKTSHLQL